MKTRFVGSKVESSNLIEILAIRARETPAERLYTFLIDGEEEVSLTYAGLNVQARAVAALLGQGQQGGGTGG
jgi:acyl-CoA synthetase (AMP-forming)/AMP-acid ligase II